MHRINPRRDKYLFAYMDTNIKERGQNVNVTPTNIDVLHETPQQTSIYLSMYIVYCFEHRNLIIANLNSASLYFERISIININ